MSKILLVEDEKFIREPFAIVLRSKSYEVVEASNGMEALRICEHTQFDIILLDLMMPILDGVGFLEQAQLNIHSPNTKVIVLSNLASSQVISEAAALGATHHELKSSINPGKLIEIISKSLAPQTTAKSS